MTASRELHYFLLLNHEQQVQAIRRLHAMGMSDQTIATATRLSVEQIKTLTAVEIPLPSHPVGDLTSGGRRSNCPRTGIPMHSCTCVGPHEVAA